MPSIGPIPESVYFPSGTQIAPRCGPMEDGNYGRGALHQFLVDIEILRSILFSDPTIHTMTIYKKRIQTLHAQASTTQDPFPESR